MIIVPVAASAGTTATERITAGVDLRTVAELAVTHDVAVGTAQRAMALVHTEGLIEVSRGRRAVVNAAAPD